MKSLILSLALVAAAAYQSLAQFTLTATDTVPFTSIEFNYDPDTITGPDWSYAWLPADFDAWINGTVYTGPGWFFAEYDADWNTVSEAFTPGYSVEVVCGVPLIYVYIGEERRLDLDDSLAVFLAEWVNLGGSYAECPLSATEQPGKKLGHRNKKP
jgi:hypothetical protein